jgi:hypothetical protein
MLARTMPIEELSRNYPNYTNIVVAYRPRVRCSGHGREHPIRSLLREGKEGGERVKSNDNVTEGPWFPQMIMLLSGSVFEPRVRNLGQGIIDVLLLSGLGRWQGKDESELFFDLG